MRYIEMKIRLNSEHINTKAMNSIFNVATIYERISKDDKKHFS